MAILTHRDVRVAGVCAAVPRTVRSVADEAVLLGLPAPELERLTESIGVFERRVSDKLRSSDLCTAAAARLMEASGTGVDEIDALIFVSQTADYFMPASACVIQARLGLPKSCLAFDINLGCSGFVYGLSVLSALMQAGTVRKALLLCGETSNRYFERTGRFGDKLDIGSLLLFGDAGSAALLIRDESASPLHFALGTDGKGAANLIVRVGASRHPPTTENLKLARREDGIYRSDAHIFMNGPEVFSFTLREVVPLAQSTLKQAGWSLDDVDSVVMHQANTFMLNHLGKRLKIPPGKLVIDMARWGNTSSASIPLAMVSTLAPRLRESRQKLLLLGFGVGLSWAGLALESSLMVVPELEEVDDSFAFEV